MSSDILRQRVLDIGIKHNIFDPSDPRVEAFIEEVITNIPDIVARACAELAADYWENYYGFAYSDIIHGEWKKYLNESTGKDFSNGSESRST